jgi:hypothetical protein
MSKNTNEVRGRGRPRKELIPPTTSTFTVNDLVACNPQIICRLSVYTRLSEQIKNGTFRYTGETVKTGGVGKPLDVIQTMASYRRSRAQKRVAKARRLAKITVNLTPAPVPVTA